MKIKGYRKLTDGKWLNLFDVAYVDDAGTNRNWQVVSRNLEPKCVSGRFDKPDAVLMIPFHRIQKKLVVLREYRVSLAGFQYEFPAGLIDSGETIEEAAKRELMEETGLQLMHITRLSPPLYNTAGLADESVVLVYGDCEGQPSNAHNQGGETIEVCMLSPQAAQDILEDPTGKFDTKLWIELDRFSRAVIN
jgi:ADP-ribose pyrophosphatase